MVKRMKDCEDCASCEKKGVACISFVAHENAMMHKDADNERSHKTTRFVCISMIILAMIFVVTYTIRMNSFVDTIKEMNAMIVQLAIAKGIISP